MIEVNYIPKLGDTVLCLDSNNDKYSLKFVCFVTSNFIYLGKEKYINYFFDDCYYALKYDEFINIKSLLTEKVKKI
jgi:hypothetical protein